MSERSREATVTNAWRAFVSTGNADCTEAEGLL
jgi:hypothetical protein